MCLDKRKIINPYTHQALFVSCGHCPACKQAKADGRARRMRNQMSNEYTPLFVHLTYKNMYCPYILEEDVHDKSLLSIPIYRDFSIRLKRSKNLKKDDSYTFKRRSSYVQKELTKLELSELDPQTVDYIRSYRSYKNLNRDYIKGRIGICYYKDAQNFLKRLRHILERHYNYDNKNKWHFYMCSEYGSSHARPHFHAVFYVPKSFDSEKFSDAIAQAWPFSDFSFTRKRIEIAVHPESYVASYVNKSSTLPHLFDTKGIKPTHSYSQGFGMARKRFNFLSVCNSILEGNLEYVHRYLIDGVPTDMVITYPKYVFNRYFPKFKGYCRLNDDEIIDVVSTPEHISYFASRLELTVEDQKTIYTRLKNKLKMAQLFDVSPQVYARLFLRAWSLYASTAYKRNFKDVKTFSDLSNCYDLVGKSFRNSIWYNDLRKLNEATSFLNNPNFQFRNLNEHARLTTKFFTYDKTKKQNDIAFEHSNRFNY